jgi:hypothetical protein
MVDALRLCPLEIVRIFIPFFGDSEEFVSFFGDSEKPSPRDLPLVACLCSSLPLVDLTELFLAISYHGSVSVEIESSDLKCCQRH